MEIRISDAASNWFKSEMLLKDGDAIRFFGKVYGNTPVHEGFSMGMEKDDVSSVTLGSTTKDGITYFVDERDRWFFEGYNLVIGFDEQLDEPKYTYETAK